jgi:hypothetical protein
MVLRHLFAGLALAALLGTAGCCHSCGRTCSAPPAIVNTAPVNYPPPDPCCGGAPPVQAYSSPAPCCTSLKR